MTSPDDLPTRREMVADGFILAPYVSMRSQETVESVDGDRTALEFLESEVERMVKKGVEAMVVKTAGKVTLLRKPDRGERFLVSNTLGKMVSAVEFAQMRFNKREN